MKPNRTTFRIVQVLWLLVAWAPAAHSGGAPPARDQVLPGAGLADPAAQAVPASASALPPLRVMAEQLGITVGTVLDGSLFSDPTYRDLITREFNMAAVDGGIYWNHSEPERGRFDLEWADHNVAFARERGLLVRGHPLVWVDNGNSRDQRPDWLVNAQFGRDEWTGILRNHVTQLVSHFQGQMQEWSVVNELDPRGILHTYIGPEYVEMAFEAARQADPDALLIYNDYNNEKPLRAPYNFFSNSFLTLEVLQRLGGKGLIDGVGLQLHVFSPQTLPDKETLIEAMQGYGVPIYITECDVDISDIAGTQEERFAYQAGIFARITDACLESGVCKSLTFWGVGDRYSWIEQNLGDPNADPTLFDDNFQPKPAYYAVQQSFYNHLPGVPTAGPVPAAPERAGQSGSPPLSVMPAAPQGSPAPLVWECSPQDISPCNTTLRAVDLLTPQDGWAVGDQGTILHWDGASWSRVASPTSHDLTGVSAVSSTDVWAVGFHGTIVHWDGAAWSLVDFTRQLEGAFDDYYNLRAVRMVSSSEGWATGGYWVLLHWDGASWTDINWQAVQQSRMALAVSPANTLWGAGVWSIIQVWTGSAMSGSYDTRDDPNGRPHTLRAIDMLSDTEGWAVGERGQVIRRTMGQYWSSWQTFPSPTTRDLYGLRILSPVDGWSVGEGGTILHWDGNAWLQEASPTTNTLYGIDLLTANEGWAVGQNVILRWNGSGWLSYQDPGPSTRDLMAVSAVSNSDAWAVGFGGTILHWEGAGWVVVPVQETGALHGIRMLSSSDGWAVGAHGLAVHWDGLAWDKALTPTTKQLHTLSAVSATDIWAAGMEGTLLHWDGTGWTQVQSPTSNDLWSIAMVSGADGWAVGNGPWQQGCTLLHWDGIEWSDVPCPIAQSLSAVAMLSAGTGWAVGENGTILAWAGGFWTLESSPTTQDLTSITALSPADVWVTGASGAILHYDGAHWAMADSPSLRNLYGIDAAGNGEMWSVGSGGTILHWLPEHLATLAIDYATGAPGSFFTVSGQEYPAGGTVQLKVNGYQFPQQIPVDAEGRFTVLIDTSFAPIGSYVVTATSGSLRLQVAFTLAAEEPLRPRSGDYLTLVIPEPVTAAFEANPTGGYAPLPVTLTNQSTGAFDTCAWDFGDGGASGDCGTPGHTYVAAGAYSVTLTVSGPGGTDTLTRPGYITVSNHYTYLPLLIRQEP